MSQFVMMCVMSGFPDLAQATPEKLEKGGGLAGYDIGMKVTPVNTYVVPKSMPITMLGSGVKRTMM